MKSRVIVLTSFSLLLSACGAFEFETKRQLREELIDDQSVRIISAIEQEEIFLEFTESSLAQTVPTTSLVDILFKAGTAKVDQEINRARHADAERTLSPLLAVVDDIDFRSQFWTALEDTADGLSWLNDRTMVTTADQTQVNITEPPDAPTLTFNTTYSFSNDALTFRVRTHVRYYVPGTITPAYFNTIDHVVRKEADTEAAVNEWAENNGAAYRKALTDAIVHTMETLSADLDIDDVAETQPDAFSS